MNRMNYAVETISIKTIKNTNTDKPDFVMPPETFQMLINEGIINL